jgi:hypothetical protein
LLVGLDSASADHGLVAVFDGMGGAGSAVFTTANGDSSGAYLASRLARQVVDELSAQLSDTHAQVPDRDRGAELDEALYQYLPDALRDRFDQEAQRLGPQRSRLRSSLLKVLPTTMAAAHYYPASEGDGSSCCIAYWAGDSRVFALLPSDGLMQLSRDDLRSGGDALDSLTQDSPLSNCINASGDFEIHQNGIRISEPYVVVVATDGCFSYLPTPAHFEALLLESLTGASTGEEWGWRIQAAVSAVAGDDASLAAVALGWPDLAGLQDSFSRRLELLREAFIEPLRASEHEVDQLQSALAAKQADVRRLRSDLWVRYREGYERFIPSRRQGDKA